MLSDNPHSRRSLILPDFTVAGRTLVVTITGARLVIFVLSLVAVIWAIYYQVRVGAAGDYALLATGVIVLLPIVISLVLAPKQKSEDHSATASLAVRELQELRRSQATILEDLGSVNLDVIEFEDKFSVMRSIDELQREYDQVGRSIGHWLEVSPTVVHDAMNKQAKHAALLAEMEKGWTPGEDQK